jgi:hypothetical protein
MMVPVTNLSEATDDRTSYKPVPEPTHEQLSTFRRLRAPFIVSDYNRGSGQGTTALTHTSRDQLTGTQKSSSQITSTITFDSVEIETVGPAEFPVDVGDASKAPQEEDGGGDNGKGYACEDQPQEHENTHQKVSDLPSPVSVPQPNYPQCIVCLRQKEPTQFEHARYPHIQVKTCKQCRTLSHAQRHQATRRARRAGRKRHHNDLARTAAKRPVSSNGASMVEERNHPDKMEDCQPSPITMTADGLIKLRRVTELDTFISDPPEDRRVVEARRQEKLELRVPKKVPAVTTFSDWLELIDSFRAPVTQEELDLGRDHLVGKLNLDRVSKTQNQSLASFTRCAQLCVFRYTCHIIHGLKSLVLELFQDVRLLDESLWKKGPQEPAIVIRLRKALPAFDNVMNSSVMIERFCEALVTYKMDLLKSEMDMDRDVE